MAAWPTDKQLNPSHAWLLQEHGGGMHSFGEFTVLKKHLQTHRYFFYLNIKLSSFKLFVFIDKFNVNMWRIYVELFICLCSILAIKHTFKIVEKFWSKLYGYKKQHTRFCLLKSQTDAHTFLYLKVKVYQTTAFWLLLVWCNLHGVALDLWHVQCVILARYNFQQKPKYLLLKRTR